MISAIAQAIASILASGTCLTGTEQIDFGYPGGLEESHKSCLNLYLYEIRATQKPDPQSHCSTPPSPSEGHGFGSEGSEFWNWFDVVFALMARDHTALGEQRMLSESLTLLLRYPYIPARFLTPPLQVDEILPLRVTPMTLLSQPTFWSAIGIPLRPALQVSVTTPFKVSAPHPSHFLNISLPSVPP